MTARVEEARVNAENLAAAVAELEVQAEQAALTPEQREELNGLRERREAETRFKETLNEELEGVLRDSRAHSERAESLAEERHKQEIERTKIDSELENLQARISEEYGETYESCLAYKDESFDLKAGQAAVNRLRREISSLGAINHNAIEEYEALRAQYEEMCAQRDDVQRGIDDTGAALEELEGGDAEAV